MLNGIVDWGESVSRVMSDGQLLVKQVKNSDRTPLVSVLLEGAPGTGKTALASKLAVGSEFPLIKLISPENMVGLTELTKVTKIKKVRWRHCLPACHFGRLVRTPVFPSTPPAALHPSPSPGLGTRTSSQCHWPS